MRTSQKGFRVTRKGVGSVDSSPEKATEIDPILFDPTGTDVSVFE